jgi:hypothetical protein
MTMAVGALAIVACGLRTLRPHLQDDQIGADARISLQRKMLRP